MFRVAQSLTLLTAAQASTHATAQPSTGHALAAKSLQGATLPTQVSTDQVQPALVQGSAPGKPSQDDSVLVPAHTGPQPKLDMSMQSSTRVLPEESSASLHVYDATPICRSQMPAHAAV